MLCRGTREASIIGGTWQSFLLSPKINPEAVVCGSRHLLTDDFSLVFAVIGHNLGAVRVVEQLSRFLASGLFAEVVVVP